MGTKSKLLLTTATLFLSAGCATTTSYQFATSVDGTGCMLEQIAAEEGISQHQFDSLSPDGSKIAVGWNRSEEERGTYILDLATGERTDLPGFNNGAVFSPDENFFVSSIYVDNGRTDIAEYSRASGEMTIIAPDDAWEWLASYSSDGETILFNSYRRGESDIYTYKKSNGALTRWTDFDGYEAHGQFSPDDSKILFHRLEGGEDFNIYVIDVATGDISRITSEPSEEGYGSWSPDGNTIVFSSDRSQASGETDLYLMTADGENVRRLTDDPAKDAYPFFSPDGKYIYFNADREPAGVYRITLDDNLGCIKTGGTASG